MAYDLVEICDSFEKSNEAVFLEEKRFTGTLLNRIQRPVYVPGSGIYFEVHFQDHNLEKPENEFYLSFLLPEMTVVALTGLAITDGTDVNAIVRNNESKVIAAIRKWIEQRGLSSPAGGPRVVLPKDLH